MKTGLYDKYYKFGLEHFINKRIMGLRRTNRLKDALYFGLILIIISLANLF